MRSASTPRQQLSRRRTEERVELAVVKNLCLSGLYLTGEIALQSLVPRVDVVVLPREVLLDVLQESLDARFWPNPFPLFVEARLRVITLAEHYGVPDDENVEDKEWLELAGATRWPVFMKGAANAGS